MRGSEALENVSDQSSAATTAWVAARHAEESALLGDKAQALQSWRRAEEAFGIADSDEDRPWTWFLDRDRFDTFRVAICLKVGKWPLTSSPAFPRPKESGPHIQSWAAELGLTAPDAIARAAQPPSDIHRQQPARPQPDHEAAD